MTKCWIIETGEYSDYSVAGIFTTEENAKAAMERAYGNGRAQYTSNINIVEREMDPNIAEMNEGLKQFHVSFNKDGTRVSHIFSIENADGHYRRGDFYCVWAHDEPHAIKIAAECHAQYQAQKAGIAL